MGPKTVRALLLACVIAEAGELRMGEPLVGLVPPAAAPLHGGRPGVRSTWTAREAEEHLGPDPHALVEDVVKTLETRLEDVDAAIRESAEHWPLERLAATDRAILRAAVAEMIGRPGTPARVLLDEAIELAKRYGSEESGRFVNGVLDRIARRLRASEL